MKQKEKMTLQIVMSSEARNALHKNGRISGCRDRIHFKDWVGPYEWIAAQMIEKVGSPEGSEAWPLWAWYKKPDCEDEVEEDDLWLLTFVADNDQVVLSDFETWHYALNGWYLPDLASEDEGLAEGEAFDEDLEGAGIDWFQRPYPAPYWDRVQASWQRIFDIGEKVDAVQATFWELGLEQIIAERPYARRQMKLAS